MEFFLDAHLQLALALCAIVGSPEMPAGAIIFSSSPFFVAVQIFTL